MQDAERLTHRGIFKCLAFKCYLKGIFYYAYMHADTNSLRLFKVAILGLQIIKYFSHKHKLHRFETKSYICSFSVEHFL